LTINIDIDGLHFSCTTWHEFFIVDMKIVVYRRVRTIWTRFRIVLYNPRIWSCCTLHTARRDHGSLRTIQKRSGNYGIPLLNQITYITLITSIKRWWELKVDVMSLTEKTMHRRSDKLSWPCMLFSGDDPSLTGINYLLVSFKRTSWGGLG